MKKTALITGASRSIGATVAQLFSQKGYNIALHYNKSEKEARELCDILKQNGSDVLLIKEDLKEKGAAKRTVQKALEHFGKVDVLVNNAGAALIKPFLETEDDEGEKLINLDLIAQMQCAKYAARDMVKRKSGKIINVSSVWGICGASCEVYYSAAKAGIIGFTKALSKELAASGIQVNAVAPGVIDTDMNKNLSDDEKKELIQSIPAGRMGSSYEIAKAVLYLASADADYITGQTLNISGGFLI